jgi:transcriptional regulator with XRE-family HTH domain
MPEQRYWWDSYGPFDPDEHGYPNAGQVVRHYRLLKKWSPAQLGEAMGKTARWVQAMEKENQVPEAISRRRALATILGIPPFLLGLAPIERVGQVLDAVTAVKKTTIATTTLAQYQEFLQKGAESPRLSSGGWKRRRGATPYLSLDQQCCCVVPCLHGLQT